MSFEARYEGRCSDCGEHIDRGTLIRYDPSDRIVHAHCEDTVVIPDRPVEVCQECWLQKPCGCGEF